MNKVIRETKSKSWANFWVLFLLSCVLVIAVFILRTQKQQCRSNNRSLRRTVIQPTAPAAEILQHPTARAPRKAHVHSDSEPPPSYSEVIGNSTAI